MTISDTLTLRRSNRKVYDSGLDDQRSALDGQIAINPSLAGHRNNVILFN